MTKHVFSNQLASILDNDHVPCTIDCPCKQDILKCINYN